MIAIEDWDAFSQGAPAGQPTGQPQGVAPTEPARPACAGLRPENVVLTKAGLTLRTI